MTDTPLVKHRYRVLVNENSHYMDESERHLAGEYERCEEAIEACRRIVDFFLAATHRPSMPVGELMKLYTLFGEDPFIVTPDPDCAFSAWDYARQRCAEICTLDEKD
jgi:CRISPR/Cas system-associated protein Cas7 (RAMP superfamily)